MKPAIPFRSAEFWSLAGVGAAALALLWMTHLPKPAPSASAADNIQATSRMLDHELLQTRLLHCEIDNVMNQLEQGAISLAQAADLAVQAVHQFYPRFTHLVALTFHGRTEKQTLAHLLVTRAIVDWGVPARNAKTAELVHEYNALFPGDAKAQGSLRESIEWYSARPRNRAQGTVTAPVNLSPS